MNLNNNICYLPEEMVKNRLNYEEFMEGITPTDNVFVELNNRIFDYTDLEIRETILGYLCKDDDVITHPLKPAIVHAIYCYLYWFYIKEMDQEGDPIDFLIVDIIPEHSEFILNLSEEKRIEFSELCEKIIDYLDEESKMVGEQTGILNKDQDVSHYSNFFLLLGWVEYTTHYFLLEYTQIGFSWLITRYSYYLEYQNTTEENKPLIAGILENDGIKLSVIDKDARRHLTNPDNKTYKITDYEMHLDSLEYNEEESKVPNPLTSGEKKPKLNQEGEAIIDSENRQIENEGKDLLKGFEYESIKREFERIPTNLLYGCISVFGEFELYDEFIKGIHQAFPCEMVDNKKFLEIRQLPIYEEDKTIRMVTTMESPFTVMYLIEWDTNSDTIGFSDRVARDITIPLHQYLINHCQDDQVYININGHVVLPSDTNTYSNDLPVVRLFESKIYRFKELNTNVEAFLGYNLDSYKFGISKAIAEWRHTQSVSYDELEGLFNQNIESLKK